MFMAGVSHTPRLFSFISIAPAAPTRSTSCGFQVQASRVAQGQAVVYTPISGWIRTPAGPSAVITLGTPYSGRFPMPKVFATPVFGWPQSRSMSWPLVSWARNTSMVHFPSATSISRCFSSVSLKRDSSSRQSPFQGFRKSV